MKGKKSSLKKGKGKKKSGGKKSEWDFEGGTGFTAIDSTNQSYDARRNAANEEGKEDKKRKYRHTQEKDEVVRRSRFKQELAKQKKHFVKKMRVKVEFNDILEKKDISNISKNSQPSTKVKIVSDHLKSDMSIVDRLQLMLNYSTTASMKPSTAFNDVRRDNSDIKLDSYDDNQEEDWRSDEDIDSTITNDPLGKESYQQMNRMISTINSTTDDLEIVDTEDYDEEYENNEEVTGDAFDKFFTADPNIEASPVSGKLTKLHTDGLLAVYGLLNHNFPITQMSTLQDISKLPKLWRSRGFIPLHDMSKLMLPYYSTYADVFIEAATFKNNQDILRSILQHVMIHSIKARNIVIKHNAKLRKVKLDSIVSKSGSKSRNQKRIGGEDAIPSEMQDQGFTRPRVLILCPFRSSAMACLNGIVDVLGENTTLSNMDRFSEEFGPPEEEDDGKSAIKKKPDDWKYLFAGTNVDDDFKIGLQLNPGHGKGQGVDKGVYVRMFTDFYMSDIIIASPLGLKLLLENKGKAERDFLSSIEIAVVYQADVLYFQNWEHVDFILRNMNQLPSIDRGTDFSRVRPYFLEGKSHMRRQLIISSSFNHPLLQAAYREFGTSFSSTIRCKPSSIEGSISDVIVNVDQVLTMVPVQSLQTEDDDRFQYFKSNVMSSLMRLKQSRTLIITPSYLHFIRIRNYLMENEINAAYISEYSRDSEVSRARSRFFHGHHDILLYSGRAHFFSRLNLRGAMHLILYSLPEYAEYYAEFVNMLSEASRAGLEADMSAIIMFTKYERMFLEKIVGSQRCDFMLTSGKSTFVFK